jgi:hypothetical protein
MLQEGRGVKFDSSQSAGGFTQKLNYSVDDRSDIDNLIASWVLGIHDQERFSNKIAGKQLHQCEEVQDIVSSRKQPRTIAKNSKKDVMKFQI